jgi:hypothetical protein
LNRIASIWAMIASMMASIVGKCRKMAPAVIPIFAAMSWAVSFLGPCEARISSAASMISVFLTAVAFRSCFCGVRFMLGNISKCLFTYKRNHGTEELCWAGRKQTKEGNHMRIGEVYLRWTLVVCAVGLVAFGTTTAAAHCDTMDGPVVKEAQAAIEKGDVTPLLKWVKKEDEAEIKAAFKKTVIARRKGAEAKEIADRWFLETLVRIHRAGEGAPFTGLKPAGTDLPHVVVAADKALEGSLPIEEVAKHVSSMVEEGIKKRFAVVAEKKKKAASSVEAGREYVAAYVEYVHFVEGIAAKAQGQGGEHHHDHHEE